MATLQVADMAWPTTDWSIARAVLDQITSNFDSSVHIGKGYPEHALGPRVQGVFDPGMAHGRTATAKIRTAVQRTVSSSAKSTPMATEPYPVRSQEESP